MKKGKPSRKKHYRKSMYKDFLIREFGETKGKELFREYEFKRRQGGLPEGKIIGGYKGRFEFKTLPKILYPNCSELIADFNIHDPEEFYDLIKELGRKHNWLFDPLLTIKLLERMTRGSLAPITVIDTNGNYTSIEYGSNGYDDELGFRLDSGCNDYDETQYSFFEKVEREGEAEIKAYDGGSTENYNNWCSKKSL